MPSTLCSAALGLASAPTMSQLLKNELPLFPNVSWVDQTGSTNADLLTQAKTNSGRLVRPWLLGAHQQEHGRGRAGRIWHNRHGAHLMFSCAFDVFLPARQLATLSPLAGIAATEALRSFLSVNDVPKLTMKWPNDLLWQQAKLAGILTEVTRASTSPISQDHHVIIIGIGVNLHDARTLSNTLNRKIADWSEIVETAPQLKNITAVDLTARIAKAWYQALNEVSTYGFSDLPSRYKKVDGLRDQPLNIIDNDQVILSGLGAGINESGQLLLRRGTETYPVSVGEVSVRPFPSERSL